LSTYFEEGSLLFDLCGMKICHVEKGGLFYLSLFLSFFFTFLAMLKLGLFAVGSLQATPHENKDGSLSFTLQSQADACDFLLFGGRENG
jgi:hypothetical protein